MKMSIVIVSLLLTTLTAQAANTIVDGITYSTNVAWTINGPDTVTVINGGVLQTGVGLSGTTMTLANPSNYAAMAWITGAGSLWTNTGTFLLSGANLRLTVTNGGTLYSSKFTIGNGNYGVGDVVLVTGSNSTMNIGYDVAAAGSQLLIGNTFASNQTLLVQNGGAINVASQHTTALGVGGFGNSMSVTGTNSTFSGGRLYLGNTTNAFNNKLTIGSGGKVIASSNVIIGVVGNSNSAVLYGAGSELASVDLYVGFDANYGAGSASSRNLLSISSGSKVISSGTLKIGQLAANSNNSVLVTDTASTLLVTNASQYIIVGNAGSGNSLTISNGGKVYNNYRSSLGQLAGSCDNTVLVTGAGSLWSNVNLYVGYVAGTTNNQVTISDTGKVYATSVTMSGVGGKFNINNGGTLAANTFSIGTTDTISLSNGTLRVLNTNTTWSPKITLADGSTSMLNTSAELGGSSLWVGVTNVISGNGALRKIGGGTLALSGANTYTGTTTVDAGKLIVNSSLLSSDINVSSGATLGGSGTVQRVTLAKGATLSVGNSPGTMTFTDNTVLSAGSTNLIEISTTGLDVLQGLSTNTLTMSGLTVFNFTSNTVANGSTFTVFTNWASITTNDASFAAVGLSAGQVLDTSTLASSGTLTVVSDAPLTYALTINNGTGGGSYTNGAQVSIEAGTPSQGQIFDQWTGDTQYVASASSASTTVTMPSQAVTLTATYKSSETNHQRFIFIVADGIRSHQL